MSNPEPGSEVTEEEAKPANPLPKWVLPVVVAALVVGLAGLGFGIYAVVKMPAKTSGPTGAAGAEGKQGLAGPAGPAGAAGPAGPTGPAGTVASTTVVNATTLTSAPDAPVGTTLVAKTTCPAGKVLLSGGAEVSASNAAVNQNVELRSSFPLSDTTWQTVGIVTAPLGTAVTMTMKPFVMCGAS